MTLSPQIIIGWSKIFRFYHRRDKKFAWNMRHVSHIWRHPKVLNRCLCICIQKAATVIINNNTFAGWPMRRHCTRITHASICTLNCATTISWHYFIQIYLCPETFIHRLYVWIQKTKVILKHHIFHTAIIWRCGGKHAAWGREWWDWGWWIIRSPGIGWKSNSNTIIVRNRVPPLLGFFILWFEGSSFFICLCVLCRPFLESGVPMVFYFVICSSW